jgi:plastocyanin
MKKIVVAAIAGLALASSAPAGAATWQAWLGEPSQAPAGTTKGATLNQFLPRAIKIRAGDKIRYSTFSFHTASYLGSASVGPPFMPDPAGATYSGLKDAAGAPFWFNGLPKFIYNVQVFLPVGSAAVTAGSIHSTGAIAASQDGPGNATLSFPKAGTYEMFCLIHPGMRQTVVVKAKAKKKKKQAKIDTKVAVKTRIARETTAGWASAAAAAATPVPANTVFAGVDNGQTTLLAFLPATLTVPVGTTVNFTDMSPTEPHNEGFGPPDWIQGFMTQTDLFPLPPGSPNQAPPLFIFGSDPPGSYVYSGSNHGNGFMAPGLTDDQPGDPPNGLPQTNRITFTKPGTYHYYCLLHGPDMSGDIVVTG